MLIVETIAKIRLARFGHKKSIKEICRDLHVSRKVVRKVIRSEATEFHYERASQPLPKIGLWLRIPIQSGHRFRFEAGRDSDLKPATIPR